jgi:hypothetical protein
MLSRRSRFLLQLFVLLTAGAAVSCAEQSSAPAAPKLVLDGLGKGTAPLDGVWQFHLGDDPSWAAPALNDSNWEQLTADEPWGAQGHANYTGFAWYRRHVTLTPAPGAAPDFALLIQRLDDAYELYWNGVLVGRNGKLPPHPVSYSDQSAQTFGLGPARNGVLAVRVWKAPLSSNDTGQLGGFETPPVAGGPEAIAARKAALDYRWLRGNQFAFALDSLYGLVALFSLLAWLRDRRQSILIWMTGFCLAPVGILLLDNAMLIRLPFNVALGLEQPVYSLEDISLWFLLLSLLQLSESHSLVRKVRIAARINATAFILDGLLILGMYNWTRPQQIADAALTTVFTVTEALPQVLVVIAIVRRKRLDSARWMVAIFAFLVQMLSVAQIAAQQGSRYTHWTLGEWIYAPLFTVNGNPISPYTVASTLLLLSIIYAVYRYSADSSRRQSALEQEFKSARELQQLLIPATLPAVPGFALSSSYRPAQEVGGDFFQIIPIEGDPPAGSGTLVILGDVSGKGLKAAMTVSLIVGAVRVLADNYSGPAELLAQLNRSLDGRMQGGFATCIALRLGLDGSCAIASAGHPSLFLNGHELSLPGAFPLGLAAAASYEETIFNVQIGDRMALYTDGLLEARNSSGELYGFDRLETLFATNPSAAQATEAAVKFGQDDDITVLTLTRLAAGEESTAVHAVPGH